MKRHISLKSDLWVGYGIIVEIIGSLVIYLFDIPLEW